MNKLKKNTDIRNFYFVPFLLLQKWPLDGTEDPVWKCAQQINSPCGAAIYRPNMVLQNITMYTWLIAAFETQGQVTENSLIQIWTLIWDYVQACKGKHNILRLIGQSGEKSEIWLPIRQGPLFSGSTLTPLGVLEVMP